jgi:beta-lactamase class A
MAGGTYDVSYFWTSHPQTATAYAGRVKRVLGPDVAKQIEIVRNEKGHYGVIYDRDGSLQTVRRLARHHAELLHRTGVTRERGLSAACPIPDRDYPSMQRKRTSHSPGRTTAVDSRLESEVDRYIKQLRARGRLAKTERTSFVVYDVTQQKKIVSINEDRPMMAASLIKNFVMLAYFHQVRHSRMHHTNRNRTHLRRMIQRSSNVSTNYFIRLLGGPRAVNRILNRSYPYFQQTRVVEYIPNGGRTYRNTTSAHDLNRFYNQLWLEHLLYSSKMKYYLGLPNGDRIYDDTCIPANVHVYNKTGTVYGMVGDGGVLAIRDAHGKQRAYIFTGMIEDRTKTQRGNRSQSFSTWVARRSEVLRRVSEGVYEYIYEVHYGGVFQCRRHGGHHLGAGS